MRQLDETLRDLDRRLRAWDVTAVMEADRWVERGLLDPTYRDAIRIDSAVEERLALINGPIKGRAITKDMVARWVTTFLEAPGFRNAHEFIMSAPMPRSSSTKKDSLTVKLARYQPGDGLNMSFSRMAQDGKDDQHGGVISWFPTTQAAALVWAKRTIQQLNERRKA